MAGSITVDRAHWLGYRWQRHGLDGHAEKAALDDLLLLGFQDSRLGGARQSLAQRASRIGSTSIRNAIAPTGPLVSLWSVRGAPHAHRSTHLDFVRDAHAPQGSDEGGAAHLDAVGEVAAALRAVVTRPTSKAEASTQVNARISGSLVTWCASCGARHVPDGLFRAAGRQAQLVLGPEEQRATMLHPRPTGSQERLEPPRLELVRAYVRVNGPVSRTQFRDWMHSGTATTAELWTQLSDDDLRRVTVDGRRSELPAALVDSVRDARKPRGVALVPPNDPYLRQVDRTLLVPESKRRAEVYRALSGPGALLVDGEVAGTWRYRRNDTRLSITPFDELSAAQRAAAEVSAGRVAAATGDDPPTVSWS